MTSTKLPTDRPSPKAPRRKRPPSPIYSAQEKAQAVLTLWTERCKPVDLCRQLRICWITLQQWQDRAMEGMLQALQSRVNLSQGGALSPRLQHLLHKKERAASTEKLALRLTQLQQSKIASPPDPAA